jgi:hypothetical protein
MVQFDKLWKSHPANWIPEVQYPCQSNGNRNFKEQCSIRMSVALQKAGADMSSFHGVCCWFGHGRQHVLRAEELASWLKSNMSVAGKVSISKHAIADNYSGKQGIVFCRNFWGEGNQGDHIDVWDGTKMALGNPNYFSRSQEVWFWRLY